MSRINRLWSRFFLKASVLHTYVETSLVFLVLLLFVMAVYQANARVMTLTSLLFFINPCVGLYYSLRLRVPGGRWYRRIGLDLLAITAPTLVFNPLVWIALRATQANIVAPGSGITTDLLFISFMAFPIFFFRVGIRFVTWWNGLSQRRMIWSLVTGNLIAVAVLQSIVILPTGVAIFFSNLGNASLMEIPDTPLAQFLYRLQMSLPMVGFAILLATAILIALLPVSIAVSYFFARRIRRRLDALLDATHAARDGQYDTQVMVSGQDEIARLQLDFNVMTENLKINVDALRGEREKVSTLLKTRRELMANVSHELRTPIATIRAYLDSMRRQQEGKVEIVMSAEDLAIIERETLRLQTLIDDLFALSRAEIDQLAMNPVPLDSAALIQKVIDTVAPLAWRVNRVELIAKLPAWLPNILADATRLEQVLRNLLHNSLRYTPPGGLIVISGRETAGYVEIQVQDTGEGIAADRLPHIWERYYRDEENGGTGLGLALVKSFIESMHGEVRVTSAPGEGACFSVRLPIAKSSLEESPNLNLPKPEPVVRASKSSVMLG